MLHLSKHEHFGLLTMGQPSIILINDEAHININRALFRCTKTQMTAQISDDQLEKHFTGHVYQLRDIFGQGCVGIPP